MGMLRQELEQLVYERMADTGGMIALWDIYAVGNARDLDGSDDAATVALRWVSALHEAIMELASKVDALDSSPGAG